MVIFHFEWKSQIKLAVINCDEAYKTYPSYYDYKAHQSRKVLGGFMDFQKPVRYTELD